MEIRDVGCGLPDADTIARGLVGLLLRSQDHGGRRSRARQGRAHGLALLRFLLLPTCELALDGLPNKSGHPTVTHKRPNPLPDLFRETNQRWLYS